MMRQKLAFVVCVPPSVALNRMNGFSPVRMTWFGSAAMISLPRKVVAPMLAAVFVACEAEASRQCCAPLCPQPRPKAAVDEHRIVALEHAERPQDHRRARGDGPPVHDQAGAHRQGRAVQAG